MVVKDYFEWAYGGVDVSMDAVGGDDCINFIPNNQKIFESLIFIPIAAYQVFWGWNHVPPISLPTVKQTSPSNTCVRITLLIPLVFVFGMEIGFKLSTKTMIWVINPCHVITILQIWLLSMPPNWTSLSLLRCLCNSTNGPFVAILFPAVHTRFLPFETETYFLQHWLIVLIPWLLLIMDRESYYLEELNDWSYAIFSTGIVFLYHWIPLQVISILSGFNMNVICCPPNNDPFYGPYYRIAAFFHQTIMCLLAGKLMRFCFNPFLKRKIKQV